MFMWWGRAVVRARWLILAISAGILTLGATWGGGLFADLASGGFDDPASESSRTAQEITRRLGSQGADVLALYSSTSLTVDDPDFQDEVVEIAARLQERPEVTSVITGYAPGAPPVLFSADRHATYLAVQLRDGDDNRKLDDLAAISPALHAPEPIATQVGGQTAFLRDANSQISDDITKAELISMPILLALSIFVFRGLVAALMPMVVGVLAVPGAFVAVRAIAQVTEVSVFSVNVITMLGLGMAIDYALFIVNRFREELDHGRSTVDAVATSIATAGRTVTISAVTVALALASLLTFPVVFLKSMALGGIFAVLVAMLAAITTLPALLSVIGPRINSLRLPMFTRPRRAHRRNSWARVAHTVMRRPAIYAVGVTALLAALGTPLLNVEFGGFDERVLPERTQSRQVSERIAADFPGGSASPITVLVTGPGAQRLSDDISRLDDVTGTRTVATRGDSTLIEVAYPGEPSSRQARELVADIRALPAPDRTAFMVGGRSAADVDLLDMLADRMPLMLALVAVSTFLLLFLAFGSLVLPIKAIVMNAISIGASFGVVVWIFQHGYLADQLHFTVTGFLEPGNMVLMLALLFGLATDYEVFLLSRVREEWDAVGDNTRSVANGLERTGGIITAAALLLIVVLGGFATGGATTIKMIGIGMVVAIAIDATLVRVVLVPATMRLLGRWNWWAPAPLAAVYRRYGLTEA